MEKFTRDWNAADQVCKNENGQLASIYNEAENAAMYYYSIQEGSHFPIWLGLKKVSISFYVVLVIVMCIEMILYVLFIRINYYYYYY